MYFGKVFICNNNYQFINFFLTNFHCPPQQLIKFKEVFEVGDSLDHPEKFPIFTELNSFTALKKVYVFSFVKCIKNEESFIYELSAIAWSQIAQEGSI